jgi:CRISPR-associated protein Cmr4
MERRLLVLLAETPVHAGGSESLGAVDLPIQRESATGLPVIWGQSLKGALRQAVRDATGAELDEEAVFGSKPPGGPDDPDAARGDRSLRRGSVSVGDAQLLLFPAAALQSCFAWLTSPTLLARLARKAKLLGVDDVARLDVRPRHGRATGTGAWKGTQVFGPFVAEVDDGAGAAAQLGATVAALACPPAFGFTREKMQTDVVLVTDTALAAAAKMATDIVARVQLDPAQKTVVHGPFYSEHLPVETVLTAVLASTDPGHLDALTTLLDGQPIQLGGDETIGKGVLWCRVLDRSQFETALAAAAASVDAPTAQTPQSRPQPGPPAANPAAMPGRRRS